MGVEGCIGCQLGELGIIIEHSEHGNFGPEFRLLALAVTQLPQFDIDLATSIFTLLHKGEITVESAAEQIGINWEEIRANSQEQRDELDVDEFSDF